MREILLVSISGPDRPGISAALTSALAAHQVNILDVSQAVIHDQLSLGLVIETGGEDDSARLMRAVLFQAHALGLQARFTPISADSYNQWVAGNGRSRYILTLLARNQNIGDIFVEVSEAFQITLRVTARCAHAACGYVAANITTTGNTLAWLV